MDETYYLTRLPTTLVIKHKRGLASEWTILNPVLNEAEIGFETDTGKFKFGNGVTAWSALPYFITQDMIAAMIAEIEVSGGLLIDTIDTDEHYKLIAFANTTVKAIPADVNPPAPPTGLAADIRLTSLTLTWTASPTSGVHYDIYRNGAKVGTTTTLSYRDTSIAAGATYLYHLIAVDTYGQSSDPTADFSAFVNPALNVAPTVEVTTWPSPLPATGKGLIRVCGSDVDAQALAYSLSVDAGAIAPTDDPSIWYFTAGGA